MLLLDLDELDKVFKPFWLWSANRPALARFRRSDHVGDPAQPLQETVRDLVRAGAGQDLRARHGRSPGRRPPTASQAGRPVTRDSAS